jgi:membrane protease YdiL (CAAX protease family)
MQQRGIHANKNALRAFFQELFTFRWQPSLDLAAVAVSWILVVAGLYCATFVIGTKPLGGMGYFLIYAVFSALISGYCLPLAWMLFVRKTSPNTVGISSKKIIPFILIQVVLSAVQYILMRKSFKLPNFSSLIPLISLALAIGLFEAVFWRGWVQLRIEESFGIIPGIILGSVLYALYHIGYGMRWSEIGFLFFIGLVFAIIFRITSNVFILWPILQPMGQLATLIRDGLQLPLAASLGFIDVLAVMIVFAVIANRINRKRSSNI